MTKKEKMFCRVYSALNNLKEAAVHAGFPAEEAQKTAEELIAREDISKIKVEQEDETPALDKKDGDALIKRVKETLKDFVGEVKITDRLTKSPMALITPEGQMSLNLERLMKAHGQQTNFNSTRILEINTRHPVIIKMASLLDNKDNADKVSDAIYVLFNQTLLSEGETLLNPSDFSERLTRFVLNGLD